MSAPLLHLAACTVDLAQRSVRTEEGSVRLTAREAELLAYLVARPGETVPREELLVEVWGYAPHVASRAVDATAARLRAKIERDRDEPDHLLTVHGVGYCFVPSQGARAATNVSERSVRLIGRGAVLADLRTRVHDPTLLTLVGPPGAGKTTLARALAAAVLGDAAAPDDVWFCDCSRATAVDGIVAAAAEALNMGPMATVQGAVDQIGHALSGRGPCLVVFDNVEQVIEAASTTFSAWMRAAPQSRLVVTSREPLHLATEQVYRLPPLDLESARELFVARARDGDHPLSAQDVPVVDEIVERLDRLPLAIELAVSRLGILSPAELLTRLDHRLDLLRSPRRDYEQRQSTLRAALDWSWDLLPLDERRAWVQCGVFRGTFDLAAAEAVLTPPGPSVVDRLQSLHDKSLLRVQTSRPRRYRMLESIAAYGADRRTEHADAWAEAQRGHARWFARRAEAAQPGALTSELEDLLAAARWALAEGEVALAAATVLGADEVLEGRGPRSVAEDLAEATLAQDPAPMVAATLHGTVAGAMQTSGRLAASKGRYARGLAIVGDGDDAVRGRLLTGMGQVCQQLGEVEDASRCLTEAVACTTGRAQGWAHARLGVLQMRLGDIAASRASHERALAAASEAEDAALEAFTLTNLVAVALRRGALDEGVSLGQRAMTVAHAAQDLRMQAIAAGNLGALHATAARHEQAAACYDEALGLHRAAGNQPGAASVLANLGDLALARGDHDAAEAHLNEARRMARSAGARRQDGLAALNLGLVAQQRGRLADAIQLLGEAAATFDDIGVKRLAAIATSHRGEARAGEGDTDAAIADLEGAIAALDAVGDALQAALSRCRLATVLIATDRPERARALADRAARAVAELDDPSGVLKARLQAIEAEL
ncbi:MAG: tetratricopeptide repeat protein [Myxococcales bacterium]|nr:tetratricopeptide repeat protein [Myxococcales bacterium]